MTDTPDIRSVPNPHQQELTPHQRLFLEQRIGEVDLSVRTSNCLKREKIERFGDLVQLTPSQLLAFHSFGKKCLKEIVSLFAGKNLNLGTRLPSWIQNQGWPEQERPTEAEAATDTPDI